MKILLRSAKDPLTPVSPEEVMAFRPASGLFGSNAGNMIFGEAVHRVLNTPSTTIVSDSYGTEHLTPRGPVVQQLNEEFDHFVVPLANAFRPSMTKTLRRFTRVIKKLDIPVTVVGVGVQKSLDTSRGPLPPETIKAVRQFMRAVLNRSAKVGVRGETTREFLAELGFGDEHVEVIGCPSLFYDGPDLRVEKRASHITRDSALSLNISPYLPRMARIAARHARRYENLVYVPQVASDLRLLLWGANPPTVSDPRMPVHTGHPLYQEDRMRFFVDPRTWIDFLRERDFSFGTRIHGNIAALRAGTPAMVLAHDTRTLELAEYHGIPYRELNELPNDIDAAELYDQADFSAFNAGQAERFSRYARFLEANGLAHVYQPGQSNPEWDAARASAPLAPAVRSLMSDDPEAKQRMVDRVGRLHASVPREIVHAGSTFQAALPVWDDEPAAPPRPAPRRLFANLSIRRTVSTKPAPSGER